MDLTPLYTVTGTVTVEHLGAAEDGERLKMEFRGGAAPDSPIGGKAHGTIWILKRPLGAGDTTAVQEVVTPHGERLVLELRGYTLAGGDGMEVRASGIIRSSAARFSDLNGRIALVVQEVAADDTVTVRAAVF
jgi:hypothetical protein